MKQISDKKRERIIRTWGEGVLFKKIAVQSNMRCQLTWQYIYNVYPYCFAHILGKGMFPELRVDQNNIIFVKNSVLHKRVDKTVAWRKHEFMQLVKQGKAIEELKRIYDQEFRS